LSLQPFFIFAVRTRRQNVRHGAQDGSESFASARQIQTHSGDLIFIKKGNRRMIA